MVGAALCVLALASCGGSSSPNSVTPATAAFVGTWAEPPGSSRRLQITLSDAPSQATLAGGADTVSGSWTQIAPDGNQTDQRGSCTGRVAGTTITLLMRILPPIPGACDENLSGTLDATGTRMSGNLAFTCQGNTAFGGRGMVTLIKQQ
jgi:hypothetical protein